MWFRNHPLVSFATFFITTALAVIGIQAQWGETDVSREAVNIARRAVVYIAKVEQDFQRGRIIFTLGNTGKLYAEKVEIEVHETRRVQSEGTFQVVEEDYDTIRTEDVPVSPGRPNYRVPYSMKRVIPQTEIDALLKGAERISVSGHVRYTDSTQTAWSVPYCFVYEEVAARWDWITCKISSEAEIQRGKDLQHSRQ